MLMTCLQKPTFRHSTLAGLALLTGNAQGSPHLILTPMTKHPFGMQLSQMATSRFVYICTYVNVMHRHLPCTKHCVSLIIAMQVPVVGINRTQDASCGSQGHCNSMMLSKSVYLDNQENAYPWRQHPQSDRSNLMPDWYWLGPYGPLGAKVECHIKPQTIDCLNHLLKQRTAM